MDQDERDEEAAYEQRVKNITKNIGVKYKGNEDEATASKRYVMWKLSGSKVDLLDYKI